MFFTLNSTLRSAFACALSLVATASLAQTINVGPGQAYATIQSGINAAVNGDTVLVSPGTYFENIDFHGKAITVTSSDGPAVTIVDGGGKGPAVTFQSSETRAAVLSNLTIQHGGGILTGTSLAVGGVYVTESSPTIKNNVITSNYCFGLYNHEAAALVQANVISATQGTSPTGGCFPADGAGIYSDGEGDFIVPGLGVDISMTAVSNTIEDNVQSGQNQDNGGLGGAVYLLGEGTTVIENNTIRRNYTEWGVGAGVYMGGNGPYYIVQNLIYGNIGGCGGGALAFDGGQILIASNTIADNIGPTQPTNCQEISQIYPGSYEYGMSGPNIAFYNNIISGATTDAAINCYQFGPPSETTQPLFQNNVLYNASGPFFGSYCIDVSGKYGNISADPQFVNPSSGDYHLQSTSPAIDSGQNSVLQTFATMTGQTLTDDFDGNTRVQAVISTACTIDMGAYEFPGSVQDCASGALTLKSSLNPSAVGEAVTFTAQLSSASGVPAGHVQFTDGTTVLGTETISGAGVSTYTTSSLSVGNHTITATYEPTGTSSSSSATLTQVINANPTPTTTTLTSSLNPAAIGQPVTFTAAVASSNQLASGTVTFIDGATALGTVTLASGVATYTTSTLTINTHRITAAYDPTGTAFAKSSAVLNESIIPVLVPTTTIISSSPNPSIGGQPVTFRVAVTSTDPTFVPSSVTLSDSYNGDPIAILTPDANGYASFTTSNLPGGYQFIYANYYGDATHAASFAFTEQYVSNSSVLTADLTSSLDPASLGQPVTFTATVTSPDGVPAGVETFQDDKGVLLGTQTLVKGVATATTSTLSPGAHTITANYIPTGSQYTAVEEILVQVITSTSGNTSTTLASSLNPANLGQPVTFTAAVTSPIGVPPGLVTFSDGTATLGNASLVNGVASLTTSSLTVGSHQIVATYSPTGTTFTGSSASYSETINDLPISTSLAVTPTSAYYGSAISMTSTVVSAGTAVTNGTVTFMDGTAVLSVFTLSSNGIATYNTSALAGGTHSITSVYSGDATHSLSTSAPVTVTIAADATALSLQALPAPNALAFQPLTVTASLSNLTTGTNFPGTITFLANGKSIGNAPVAGNGTATLTTSFPAGSYALTAAFAGTANFSPAVSAPLTEVVNAIPTAVSLIATPNPSYQGTSVTITANVNAQFGAVIPSGAVTFLDAGNPISSQTLDATGLATFPTAALAVGSHTLTAVYAGAQNFSPSTSQTYTLAILPRDFTLTTDPSITIQTEYHKSLIINLKILGPFNDTVLLGCSNLPQFASCNFLKPAVLLDGAALDTSVDIDTDAVRNFKSLQRTPPRPGSSPWQNAITFALLPPIFLLATRRQPRTVRTLFLLAAAVFTLATLSGCSGHYPSHTSPGTYTFAITGRGAATGITHTTQVTLIITQ